ncbi:MAG: DUF4177 domain-containing protein [Gemmataceae bacterium]|nr:DUF4177 domain-containing protein [Gemmataceae bacterium]
MRRLSLFVAAGIVLAALVAALGRPGPLPAQDKNPPGTATKWEYKIVFEYTFNKERNQQEKVNEKQLNDLGAEGWELCGVVSPTRGRLMSGSGTIGGETYFIFKRPKR